MGKRTKKLVNLRIYRVFFVYNDKSVSKTVKILFKKLIDLSEVRVLLREKNSL